MNNRTSFLFLALLVAVSALLLIPVDVELTVSVVFGVGLVALVFGEYARPIKPLRAAEAPPCVERPVWKLAA